MAVYSKIAPKYSAVLRNFTLNNLWLFHSISQDQYTVINKLNMTCVSVKIDYCATTNELKEIPEIFDMG